MKGTSTVNSDITSEINDWKTIYSLYSYTYFYIFFSNIQTNF